MPNEPRATTQRELPYSVGTNFLIERKEPTSHEFLARKHAVIWAIVVILYVAVDGSLKSGVYGLLEIDSTFILEPAFFIIFVWSVYRFRVVCFDRFQECHNKAYSLIDQNVHLGSKWTWSDFSKQLGNLNAELKENEKIRILKVLGEIPNFDEYPKIKGITLTSKLNRESTREGSLRNCLYLSITATKSEDKGPDVDITSIRIEASETRRLLFRAYWLLIRNDDSFSEWVVPWLLIGFAFLSLYYRNGTTIISALQGL